MDEGLKDSSNTSLLLYGESAGPICIGILLTANIKNPKSPFLKETIVIRKYKRYSTLGSLIGIPVTMYFDMIKNGIDFVNL